VAAFLLFSITFPAAAADAPRAEKSPVLKQFGIESDSASAKIFNKTVDADALDKGVGFFVSDAVVRCRAEAARLGRSNNSIGGMAGTWLELAVLVALKSKGLTPACYQVRLQNVPDAIMDVVLFSEKRGPIVLSCKTSLRERYKQAGDEASDTLKSYPNSYSCIVTLDADKKHVERVRKKIADKEIQAVEALYDETNLDALVVLLTKEKLIAPANSVVKHVRLVVK
jgi:hypothetical protein